MEILIEATRSFETDLEALSPQERTSVIQTINDCASLFPAQSAQAYRKLRRPLQSLDLNGYQSSLYTLRVSQRLRVILAVDEDPIFGQVIFTLFRVVKPNDLEIAYQAVATSLYQNLHSHHPEAAQLA